MAGQLLDLCLLFLFLKLLVYGRFLSASSSTNVLLYMFLDLALFFVSVLEISGLWKIFIWFFFIFVAPPRGRKSRAFDIVGLPEIACIIVRPFKPEFRERWQLQEFSFSSRKPRLDHGNFHSRLEA